MISPSTTATPGAPFLELRGVHKRFAGVHALRGVSLAIEAGKIYHLMGENGCGKSTLIKIIAGAQPPDEGEIIIQGRSYNALTSIESLSAGIETVYQDLSLLPNLSVAENVGLSEQLVQYQGRLAHSLDRKKLLETAKRALLAVNLPTDAAFMETPVEDLPIATRQLIAIARAIAVQARMVIMDEPTTSLTRREVDNLIAVVEGLRQQGVSVLFVTHKLDECYAIGGEVIIFRDGQKVQQGSVNSFTKKEIAQWMTGKSIEETRYRHVKTAGESLLMVRSLGSRDAFDDASFVLGRGEILGITGLLDSGRNELAKALAGVEPADRGEVQLEGQRISLRQPGDGIRAGIGYVPEDRLDEGLFLDKPIRDNIIVAVLDRLRGSFGWLNKDRSDKIANQTIADLQVATPDIDRPVKSLSGGNQQRVLIGRWLTIQPKVLILHGPTVGVDVGSKDTIYRIIQRLANDGLGVIIISDDLPELLQNCDRILVMRKGKITGTFLADNVKESDIYREMLAESTSKEAA
jgi:simple sugar transport system ATP-binding protein